MSIDYKPNERIIKKAVQWWVDAIYDPKFDTLGNGPASPEDRRTQLFGSMMASLSHKNPTPEQAAKFAECLESRLMQPRRGGFYETYISVDYGPDLVLDESAKEAGLEHIQFPWKTTMHFGKNYFTARHGYGAETMYHYPLSDNRWLITSLAGADIQKIIDHYESTGESLGLIVEQDAVDEAVA